MLRVINDNDWEGSREQTRFQTMTEREQRRNGDRIVPQTVSDGRSSNWEGTAADGRRWFTARPKFWNSLPASIHPVQFSANAELFQRSRKKFTTSDCSRGTPVNCLYLLLIYFPRRQIAIGSGRAFSCKCLSVCLYVRALNGKRPELSTPKSVQIWSMTGPRRRECHLCRVAGNSV